MSAGEFIEAGAARPEETDSLLRLMCGCFDMDFEAASPIFYADPYFELENKRVLRLNGQIISCLTVVERECWMGESILHLAGIAGVATSPEFQRRGYAGRLLKDTLQSLKARGFHLSALFPYSQDYYRKFGWETAGDTPKARFLPAQLPLFPERHSVRLASEEDISDLARIFHLAAEGQAFHCLRDRKRWLYLLTYIRGKAVYTGGDGRIAGYLFYDFQPHPVQTETQAPGETFLPVLRVLEMYAENKPAKRGLLGHLARQSQISAIEYTAPMTHLAEWGLTFAVDIKLASDNAAPASEIAFMARILDWASLLQAMQPNWKEFNGELGLTLRDPLLYEAPVRMLLTGGGLSTRLHPLPADAPTSGHFPVLEGDVRAWSPVIVGHITPEESCRRGLLTPSTEEAVRRAAPLFPPRCPFLPTADHF